MDKISIGIHETVQKQFDDLIGQDDETERRVYSILNLFRQYGLGLLKTQYCEVIESNIFGLRTHTRSHFIRLYIKRIDSNFYLFYILKKKSNQIPRKDFENIKRRAKLLQGEES